MRGFPPFPSAGMPSCGPAKAGFAELSLCVPGYGQSSGNHPSAAGTTTPSLPALILFGPPKTTCRAMVYAA